MLHIVHRRVVFVVAGGCGDGSAGLEVGGGGGLTVPLR